MSADTADDILDDLNGSDRIILSLMIDGKDVGEPWGWMTPSLAGTHIDASRQYAQKRLKTLENKGYTVNTGRGVYEITDLGVRAAELIDE